MVTPCPNLWTASDSFSIPLVVLLSATPSSTMPLTLSLLISIASTPVSATYKHVPSSSIYVPMPLWTISLTPTSTTMPPSPILPPPLTGPLPFQMPSTLKPKHSSIDSPATPPPPPTHPLTLTLTNTAHQCTSMTQLPAHSHALLYLPAKYGGIGIHSPHVSATTSFALPIAYNFAAKRLSLSTQVTRKTQYTSYVPFYGAAPWKQQHLPPIALVPMHQYRLNTPQYMPPTEL
jgi:hypothetical protein